MISKPPVSSLFVTGWFVATISVGQEAPKIEIPPAPNSPAPSAVIEASGEAEVEEVAVVAPKVDLDPDPETEPQTTGTIA